MISRGSRWAAPVRSMLIGFGFFFLGSLADVWLEQHVRNLYFAIANDALVGIAVGLLVLFYERRQRQNLIRKLEVIRLMNHHVRNSLQVISFAALAPQQEKLTSELKDAVERIEWALREVLPARLAGRFIPRRDGWTGLRACSTTNSRFDVESVDVRMSGRGE